MARWIDPHHGSSPSRRQLLTLAGAAGALSLVPERAWARTCGDVSYPETKSVDGKTLHLNGVGIREATFLKVDVYVAALYVERQSRSAEELLKLNQLEHLVLTLVRDVDADQMNDAIDEGFQKNAGGRYGALKGRIEKLRRSMPDLKEGHVISFTFAQDETIQVIVNGQTKVTLPGRDFATVFLRIWLGPQPPNDELKRGLLGGKC